MKQQPEKGKGLTDSDFGTAETNSEQNHHQETTHADAHNSADNTAEEIQDELQVYQDKYLRLAAEFENYKRRAHRDQNESIRFANESLLKNLLPIIDNLERAIQCATDAGETGPLVEGVQLTHKQFLETVGKLGVRPINSKNQPFDPAVHQAVVQVESEDVAPNTVVEEFQKGYFLHDRVLRAAMVSVSKDNPNLTQPSSTEESGEEGGISA